MFAFACVALIAGHSLVQAGEIYTQVPEVIPNVTPEQKPAEVIAKESKLNWTAGPQPQWIWGADHSKKYIVRTKFAGGAKSAWLKTTCDNSCKVWVNDVEVAFNNEWETAVEVEITKQLKPGENIVAAEVRNEGGIAGFILKLALTGADGKTEYVVTDDKWEYGAKRDGDVWKQAKIVHKLGEGPWGDPIAAKANVAATPDNTFKLLPGFQIEKIFTVPKDKLGSWVCITFDNKGRLLASDQGGQGICRITPAPVGSKEPTKVEHLEFKGSDIKLSAAQGMLYAFDALYLSVNGGPGSGLYRAKDTNGDDQYDQVVKLTTFEGGGEHGPHALTLSPDGKHIVVSCGNHTKPLPKYDHSRIPTNWSEDHLLPRQWDANGHARGILAPGGWVAQTDPEGKTWELLTMGYRNQYDHAYNAEGELFVYDADMEWDFGTPWYRPTRVSHSPSGSELGWRSGTGKWPTRYLDSLPATIDIGPGSPVGVTFGYGTKFPAKYQKALFICDFTFGTMYAVHLQPQGSTYTATKEEFVARTPLPLTDNAVGPDGALYFTIGGRGNQSELFRVTYVGKESTAPVDGKDTAFAEQRQLRRAIEQYHLPGQDAAKAVAFVYPHLSSDDRFTRYAARVALEHQPAASYQEKVFAEKNPDALLNGIVALARQGDKSIQAKLLAACDHLQFAQLPERLQCDYLRALSLVFLRMGEPDAATAAKFVSKLDASFPAASKDVNRDLCAMLIYLKSPTIVNKVIAEFQKPSVVEASPEMAELLSRNKGYGATIMKVIANSADPQKFQYAFDLRNATVGWTMDTRKAYFTFLNDCRGKSGGNSFQGFINNVEKDAFALCTDAERLAIEALGLKKPFVAKELPKPVGPGRDYTIEEIVANAPEKLKKRNFKNGEKMFAAARCVVCHRFFGDGGSTGPDLSQAAGRFQLKDLAEAIIEPSKVISDQYKASTVVTHDGKQFTGKIVSESKDTITIVINPEDASKVAELKKSDIEETLTSPLSLMPKDLLKQLNENEMYDLIAYLLSRGDPTHTMFK
jgi:putative heme-binding domain-containing protein